MYVCIYIYIHIRMSYICSICFPYLFAQPAIDPTQGAKGGAVGRTARLLCWAGGAGGAAELEKVSESYGI